MLTQTLRPKTFSAVVGNEMNNKILMSMAQDTSKGPSTILLQGLRGSGKAQPITTIIPTPNGNKKLKDLKVGDYVFDENGNPTKVLEIYHRGILPCYTVVFDDGRSTRCCNEHLWTFYGKDNQLITDTLDAIMQDKYKLSSYAIPLCKTVNYPQNRNTLPSSLYFNNFPWKKPVPNAYLYTGRKAKEENFKQMILKKGTLLDANSPYFAIVYAGSLLQAKSILTMIYSCGHKAVLKTSDSPTMPYKVYIYHTDDSDRLVISEIIHEEKPVEMLCILVDNPTHLYLTNDYIVTHNTTSARLFAKALNCKHLKKNDICGVCENCRADLNSVSWYSEYDASEMGNVSSIRELRDIFQTTSKKYNKVITLDEFQLVSKEGQAALLKVFEETPRGIYFLLATTDPEKILPTIKSRSLELVYTSKTKQEVKDNLREQAGKLNIPISEDTLDIIALRSHGIMRDAHMMLDKLSLIGEDDFLKSDIPISDLFRSYIVLIFSHIFYPQLSEQDVRDKLMETIEKILKKPVANLKDDWQDFFMNMMRISINPKDTKDIKMARVIEPLIRHNYLLPFVMESLNNWTISSFSDSLRTQAMLFVLFQKYHQRK